MKPQQTEETNKLRNDVEQLKTQYRQFVGQIRKDRLVDDFKGETILKTSQIANEILLQFTSGRFCLIGCEWCDWNESLDLVINPYMTARQLRAWGIINDEEFNEIDGLSKGIDEKNDRIRLIELEESAAQLRKKIEAGE